MISLKESLFQWHVNQVIFLQVSLNFLSVLAIINMSWGKVQEGIIPFHIHLEGFNLLLFLTKWKQLQKATHILPLAYSLISLSSILSFLLFSLSQGMGEYDEKEEETGVDIWNREAKKNCFIILLLLNRIQHVISLTARQRISWSFNFKSGCREHRIMVMVGQVVFFWDEIGKTAQWD